MTATPTRRLVKHSASYMAGQGLFFLCRLVFYCAFTRLFTPGDYGTLNLIFSALLFFIVAVRLGQNDAIVRILPEGEKRGETKRYVASIVIPMLALGAAATAMLIAATFLALPSVGRWLPRLEITSDVRWAIYLAVPIVGFRLGFDLTYSVLRALERPGAAVVLDGTRNWVTMILSLAMVFAWQAALTPFFVGQVIGEAAVFVGCLWFLVRRFSLRPSLMERDVWRQALHYGLPMVVYHLAGVGLLYVDRYIVLGFWDKHAVGEYVAGYNLAAMVQQILALPVGLAVVPLYMNLWAKGEHEQARAFVQNTLRWFWLGMFPVVLGMLAVKSDLVVLLATEKYREASPVIGYVMIGYILYGAYPIYAAGLLIHKKTGTMCVWMVVALAINIVANLILIPRYYIVGAARATALAYVFLSIALALASRRYLRVRLWPRQATVYLLAAFVMYVIVSSFPAGRHWGLLGARLVAGVVVYGVVVLAADGELRRRVVSLVEERLVRRSRCGGEE